MAKSGGMQTAGKLAHFAKPLYDIIRAFIQGGWIAAGTQAVKHYWPQILAIVLFLIFLPVIILCCLPMMLFGFSSSTNTQISAKTAWAGTVSGYYDNYNSYIDEWVENVQSTVIDGVGQNTEINSTTQNTGDNHSVEYEVIFSGTKIQKNWFIALHSVTVNNNLDAVTEADVKSFSKQCVSYTTRLADENTENDTFDEEVTNMILNIYYRSPDEIMAEEGFTEEEENWARLIYKTLEMGHNSSVGTLGSLFLDSSW